MEGWMVVGQEMGLSKFEWEVSIIMHKEYSVDA